MNYFKIEITPILTLSKNNAICNIIEVDGITIMFDCGWNETFSEDIAKIYNE
jgi:Cft2 family RNA processing exonuclease